MDAEPPLVDVGWELFDATHEALRSRARDFVATAIMPEVDAWEAAGEFPRELFAEAGERGLFGWKVAPELGGCGADLLADAVVTEELSGCWSGGVAAGLGAHKDLGSYYVWRFGTDEQRRRWLPAAMRGEVIGALAVTEPGAGSDVAGVRTRAVRQPDGDWVLVGSKVFITNGTWADFLVVAAVTDPDAGGHHGMTLFLVEREDPGFASRRIPTLGWRTSHTAELSFSEVRLPAERVLGGDEQLGQGFVCIMRNFQWERLSMALGAVRSARDLLAIAPAPLDLEGLADEVAAVRSLTDHALRLHVHGQDAVREVSMAKSYACELAVRVARDVLGQLVAARPVDPLLVERADRALRDARLGPIGGGTTEIMHEIIGRGYGL
jgi:acyl-CoA dehydrogenase